MGKKTNRKILQVVMVILLIILGIKMCVPAYAVNSQMKTVDYYDPTDPNNPNKVQDGCIPLTASMTQLEGGKWYVVDEDVEIAERIIVTGNVNLILSDEKTLIAKSGITVPENVSFTVWAQSDGEKMGSLIAVAQSGDAGIGGTKAAGCGNIIINGGKISATGAHPEQRALWENDGSHGMTGWTGKYRFAPSNHSTGEEIACIPEEDWNEYIKEGTIYLLFEGSKDAEVRVTTGWWSATYGGDDFYVESMTKDSQTGWYIMEINIKEDGNIYELIDIEHLLFTGQGYTPLELFVIEQHLSAGIGGGYLGNGGNVTINGGEVCASSEENSQAIGYGEDGGDEGKLLASGMRAYVYEGTELVPVSFSNFETACRSNWVKLLKCDSHEYVDGKCKWCGGAEIKYSVTFKVVNGYWNDKLIEDKAITLSRCNYDNKELVLEEKDIPSVGNYPGEDCKEGKWDTEPVAGIIVTKDLEFTYTYAPKEVPQYIVPKDLTAAYGQTLKSVTLPDGWEWNDAESGVGNVGEHAFGAKYTPEDTDNYVTVQTNLTVNVNAIKASITAGNMTKEYDGTPLTAESYTHEGLLEGDRIASVTVTGSQTIVGKCDNTPSAAKIVNAKGEDVTDCYEITYKSGTLTVTKPDAPDLTDDQKPAPQKDLKEDGKEQVLVLDPANLPEGYTIEYSTDGGKTWTPVPTGSQSGEYTIEVLYKADENHTDFFGDPLSVIILGVYNQTESDGDWTKGSGKTYTFRIKKAFNDEVTYDNLTGVFVDGKKAESGKDYTAAKGSAIITFAADYLETLSVGEHMIRVTFKDGETSVVLKILAAIATPTPAVDDTPTTGDTSMPVLWATLILLSMAGASVVVMRRRKRA